MPTTTFEYTGSIVNYTVPAGVTTITVKAYGGQGGDYGGGRGASAQGDFAVNPGDILSILVGQQGVKVAFDGGGAGGGGSFVWRGRWPDDPVSLTNILVAAGGGGGAGNHPGGPGLTTTSGGNSLYVPPISAGGTGGQGGKGGGHTGQRASGAGGGAGILSNGGNGQYEEYYGGGGGYAINNGDFPGQGGTSPRWDWGTGGFGGGGGPGGEWSPSGGGGGGFSGGAGGTEDWYAYDREGSGGGGGSFVNSTINIDLQEGVWEGNGLVEISWTEIIDIEKEVSNDGGATWFDANEPPGPYVIDGTDPKFRITVTNTWDQTLSNIQVTDDVLGFIGKIPSLDAGASVQWVKTGSWVLGQQVNTVTASTVFYGETLTFSDSAYWYGALAAIDIEKEVSPDGGVTWFDADSPPGPEVDADTNPQFRFTVANTGSVTLTDVLVTDDDFGIIGQIDSLDPDGSRTWDGLSVPWTPGQHSAIAKAIGYFADNPYTDTDLAYWFGTGTPSDIKIYVSVDNGVTWVDAATPPGPLLPAGFAPQFRYVVTNNGNTTLTNIQVTDDVFGLIGTLPELHPGDSYEWVIIG